MELQFHESDALDTLNEDCLVEMRVWCPESKGGDGENSDEEPEEPDDLFTAEALQQAIMDQANIR